jgi:hypothetical protein
MITGLISWVLTLGGRTIRVLPRISGLPGVSGIFPDIPGLRAVMTLFYVRGCIKSPSTLSYLSLSLSFLFSTYKLSDLELVRFVGDLRGIERKSLESASELISHL